MALGWAEAISAAGAILMDHDWEDEALECFATAGKLLERAGAYRR